MKLGGARPQRAGRLLLLTALASVGAAGVTAAPASTLPLPPRVVAVTSSGRLVVLALPGGKVLRTLLAARTRGDEVAVDWPARIAYVSVDKGCDGEIESVPLGGGAAHDLGAGSLPALSPDHRRLAFVEQPALRPGCPSLANATTFAVVVRPLGQKGERVLPVQPAVASSGLPVPITHLSWSPDGSQLLASVPAVEDNEGWRLSVFSASARYWLTTSTPLVPVAGGSSWYYAEAVYLGADKLFADRQCCVGIDHNGGTPVEVRLDEVGLPGGAVVHQVAVGFPTRPHSSLAVDPSGRWLLYLSGDELYVSDGGATPVAMASGLAAAAWAS